MDTVRLYEKIREKIKCGDISVTVADPFFRRDDHTFRIVVSYRLDLGKRAGGNTWGYEYHIAEDELRRCGNVKIDWLGMKIATRINMELQRAFPDVTEDVAGYSDHPL